MISLDGPEAIHNKMIEGGLYVPNINQECRKCKYLPMCIS